MGQAKSLSAASLEEDLKGINQQMNAKQTTETILEETAEPQQISACWDTVPRGKESDESDVCVNILPNGLSWTQAKSLHPESLGEPVGPSGLGSHSGQVLWECTH